MRGPFMSKPEGEIVSSRGHSSSHSQPADNAACNWCANFAPRKYMRVIDGSLLCIDCIKQVAETCYTKS